MPPPSPPANEPPLAGIEPPAPEPRPPESWFFESLSRDGKRALLRRLDVEWRAMFHARVVEVDTGRTLDEARLDALAKLPVETVGASSSPELESLLKEPAVEDDLVHG